MPYNFLGQGGIVNTGPIEDIYYIDPVTFTQSLIPNNDADAATKFYVDEHILEVMDSEIFNPNLVEAAAVAGRINVAVLPQMDGTNNIVLTVADVAIESAQLAELSVTTGKVVDRAITLAKIDSDVTVSALLDAYPPQSFLPFNSQQLRDVADPTAPQHAATMNYVDTHEGVLDTELSAGFGINIDPSGTRHAIDVDSEVIATRNYVDGLTAVDTDTVSRNADGELQVSDGAIGLDQLSTDGVVADQTVVFDGTNWTYDRAGSAVFVNGTEVEDPDLRDGTYIDLTVSNDSDITIEADTELLATRRYVDSEILAHTGDAGGHPIGFGLDTDDGNLNVDTEVIATRNYVDNILIDTDDLATDGVSMGQTFVYDGSNWIYDDAGSSVSVNGTEVEDPNFIDGTFISFGVSGANITPNIDTDTQLATRRYVDSEIQEHLLDSVGFIGGPGVSASLISGDTELVSLDVDTEFFGFDTEGNDGILTINDDSITRDQIAPLTIVAGNVADAAITGQKLQANTAGDGIRFDTDHAGGFGTITSLSVNFDSDSGLRFVDIPSPIIPGLVQDRTLAVDTDLISTRTYVDDTVNTAITNLIDGAPAALDTLNELAEALNDDSDAVVTLINADIALGLRIDSEAAARISGDSDLQMQIDNLNPVAAGAGLRYNPSNDTELEINPDLAGAGLNYNSSGNTLDVDIGQGLNVISDLHVVLGTGLEFASSNIGSPIDVDTDTIATRQYVDDHAGVIDTDLSAGQGIRIDAGDPHTINVDLAGNDSGLAFDSNQLRVNDGRGIALEDDGVYVLFDSDSGLAFDSNDRLEVLSGDGITTTADGVEVNLADTSGLMFNGNGELLIDIHSGVELGSEGLSVALANENPGLQFIGGRLHVGAGEGIARNDGDIDVVTGNGIHIDGDAVAVDRASNSGLDFDNGGLHVGAGSGIERSGSDINVNTGDGIHIVSDAVAVDLDGTSDGTSGLRLNSDGLRISQNIDGFALNLTDGVLDVDTDITGANPNVPDFDQTINNQQEYALVGISDTQVAWRPISDTEGQDVTNFIQEGDTPDSYVDAAGDYVRVNEGESALEFFDPFPTERTQDADSELVLTVLNGLPIRRFEDNRIVFAEFEFQNGTFAFSPRSELRWDEPFSSFTLTTGDDDLVQNIYVEELTSHVDGTELNSETFTAYSSGNKSIVTDATALGDFRFNPMVGQYDGSESGNRNIEVVATASNGQTMSYPNNYNWNSGGFDGTQGRGNTPTNLDFDNFLGEIQVRVDFHNTVDADNIHTFSTTSNHDGAVSATTHNASGVTFTLALATNVFHSGTVQGTATASFTQPITVNPDTDESMRTFVDTQDWDIDFISRYKTWVITGTDQNAFSESLLGTLESTGYTLPRHSRSSSLTDWHSRDPFTFDNSSGTTAVNGYLVVPSSIVGVEDPDDNPLTLANAFLDPNSLDAPIAGVTETEIELGHTGFEVTYYVYTFTIGAGGILNVNVNVS